MVIVAVSRVTGERECSHQGISMVLNDGVWWEAMISAIVGGLVLTR